MQFVSVHHRPSFERLRGLALLCALFSLPLLVACGGGDEEIVIPTPAPEAVAPLSTPTPLGDAEAVEEDGAEAVDDDDVTSTEVTPAELPDDGGAAIIQLARIEFSPWEPALLAQMTPHFSLRADGSIAFTYHSGGSEDGWYQSAITGGDALSFLRKLVDDIGVLELVDRYGETEVVFENEPDGSPPTCPGTARADAVGVVYVRTHVRQGQFVFSQCTLDNPTGPNAEALVELQKMLTLVEFWKQGLIREYSAEEREALRSLSGWWSDLRAPMTPDSLVAYGTRATTLIPDNAPRATWPLPTAMEGAFNVQVGSTPQERRYTNPDHVALIRAAMGTWQSTWGTQSTGPLWSDGTGTDYVVGLRPAVPGGNHVVVDYEYVAPLLVRGVDDESDDDD